MTTTTKFEDLDPTTQAAWMARFEELAAERAAGADQGVDHDHQFDTFEEWAAAQVEKLGGFVSEPE